MSTLLPLLLAVVLVPASAFASSNPLSLCNPTSTSITQIGNLPVNSTGNETYTVQAVVTGVYANLKTAGFYVQETADLSDGNPQTSDAIYVAQNSPIVELGDLVQVNGSVQKSTLSPGSEQLMFVPRDVRVLSSNNMLPIAALLNTAVFSYNELKAYTGMRVTMPMPLMVADVYDLKGKGQVTLATGGRLYQPTQFIDPNDDPAVGTASQGNNNIPAIRAFEESNLLRTVVLDNAGGKAPDGKFIPFVENSCRTLRVGSTIKNLCGVLSFEGERWHLHASDGSERPIFSVARPAVPQFGKLDVKLASFNVNNYFNGDGQGGGFPTERGAKTAAEFARQRAKIIKALVALKADVIGLTEVENDGNGPASAAQDLLAGLNQALGKPVYALVNDGGAKTQSSNTDQIHNVLLYKPAVVKLHHTAFVDAMPDVFERPPLAQLFTLNKPKGETFAVVVNHFKSKSSSTGDDADQHDGQGGSNDRRRQQARELVKFINLRVMPAGTNKVICLGDYNANYEEDPLDIMRAAGLVVATPPTSASFVYRGNIGSLDHCIVSSNLVGFIDVKKWNINSFEPAFQDYAHSTETPATATPYRCSDHDPVLIGVRFLGIGNAPTVLSTRLLAYPAVTQGNASFQIASVMPPDTKQLSMEFALLNGQPMLRMQGQPEMLQSELGRVTSHLAPGIYLLKLKGKGFDLAQQVIKE